MKNINDEWKEIFLSGMNNKFNLGIIERFELFFLLFFYFSNYNDDFLISGFHLNFLLVIKSRMKLMQDYGKNKSKL